MRALRDRWTLTSRLHDRADEGQPNKYVLDCSIGWQNYFDQYGDGYPADSFIWLETTAKSGTVDEIHIIIRTVD